MLSFIFDFYDWLLSLSYAIEGALIGYDFTWKNVYTSRFWILKIWGVIHHLKMEGD